MGKKSERELAYIHDLYISPDWGERFAELFDEHIVLPEKGRALYIGMGTGSHALSLRQRASKEIAFTFIDESEERLEIARAKANAVKMEDSSSFSASQLDSLKFEDGSFDLVIGDLSLHPPERIPAVLSEMVRVAAKRGQVALLCTAASSFGEFFSIYWEAITNAELDEHTQVVENLIVEQPTISDLEQLVKECRVVDE
jgi:ubiquinone/menaquinone biosynthesis C-methylase UbiE